MTTQVICQECCREVVEEETTIAEEGSRVCLACASVEAEEGRAEKHTSPREECCERTCSERSAVSAEAELSAGRTEPCGWEDGD